MNTENIPEMSESEEEDEELDPRIKMELEKLNAATDGINHLETEFGEAQALFQQMMQDATFQLKSMHQDLGKAVDKSRPYYEALKLAKFGHNQLHEAALKFEQAQSRHYNAKKRVMEAEKKAFSSESRRIDPALQEMLNQATIEVMDAAKISTEAWESHREASVEFEIKQKDAQDSYKSLKKHIYKSRPYFDLKMGLNKQLEIQKQRLEKIQEGIQAAKNAYADTLHNLEIISDDIHRARELKKKAFCEPRGQGVGADSDNDDVSLIHNHTMERIRSMTLDNVSDKLSNCDAESTASDISNDNILDYDIAFDKPVEILTQQIYETSPEINIQSVDHEEPSNDCLSILSRSGSNPSLHMSSTESEGLSIASGDSDPANVNNNIKEFTNKIDSSYEVITSHSIPFSPQPLDMLDGKKKVLLDVLSGGRKSRSVTDLSRLDYLFEDDASRRRNSAPTVKTKRSSWYFGKNQQPTTPPNNSASSNSPTKNPFARFTSFDSKTIDGES